MDRESFFNDLRLWIFQKKKKNLPGALGVLEKSAQKGTTVENPSPQGGGREGTGRAQLPLSSRSNTPARDLWFTSIPLIKRKQPAPPCPGPPSREDSKLLASWLVWLPLTQRLALLTS